MEYPGHGLVSLVFPLTLLAAVAWGIFVDDGSPRHKDGGQKTVVVAQPDWVEPQRSIREFEGGQNQWPANNWPVVTPQKSPNPIVAKGER
jgi:hypothetical protein